jgi:putative PIN family toxin of toxin-antitoxin system
VRLVLDTNAAVSGLLWHGNPGKLIDAAQAGSLTLYTSAPLLAELRGVLGREKFAKHLQARGLTATIIFEGYAALAAVVIPAIIRRSSSTIPTTTRCSRAPLPSRSTSWFPGIHIC